MQPASLAVCRPFLTTNCYLHGCPCGFYGDTSRECRCTPGIIQRYLGKISGPLLDRIDIHIEVPAVAYKELRGKDDGITSAEVRARVVAARYSAAPRLLQRAHSRAVASQALRSGRFRRAHSGNGGAPHGALRTSP
jgi:magnesium chelatase family protein